jgi:hypothetical protein
VNFVGTTDARPLVIRTNNTERMRVTETGFVGIGTATPAEKVTIEPYYSFPAATITPSTIIPFGTRKIGLSSDRGIYLIDDTDFIGLALKNEGADRKDAVIYWGDNLGADNLRFMFAEWGGGIITLRDRMTITSYGNVGIGTISPTDRLQVVGGNVRIGEINPQNTGSFPGYGRFLYFSGGPAGSTWDSDNSDLLWIARYNVASDRTELRVNIGDNCEDDAFVIGTYGSACAPAGERWDLFRVHTNGRVGIGTATPAYRLHVVGDVYATGQVYCYGAGICSDQIWKTNIKPIQNALDNVLKMRGVTYYWKVDEYPDKHFPEGEQIGFIAQEVEKVYPQVVLTDKEGYKSVDYSKLTPVLVEAIKEQQKIIEELQKVIQQLQEENSQIKQANAQLSAEIKMLNEKVDNLINSLSNDKKLGYR